MIIGFTGTQEGMSQRQKDALEHFFRSIKARAYLLATLKNGKLGSRLSGSFHHGDCIGADAEADKIARDAGSRMVIHPPTGITKRAFCAQSGDTVWQTEPYLTRNHDIVESCTILIAAPKSMQEELRSGTWATIRYARKTNKPVLILDR